MKLLGSGVFRPKTMVTSEELDRELGLVPGTGQKLSGVRTRPRAGGISLARMGAEAVKEALEEACLPIDEVDLIVFAGASFEQVLPCTAAFLQQELGEKAQGIPCVDIDSTCLSFLSGLELVDAYLARGRYRRILLVNGEVASQHLNPDHRESYYLFGDGATAFLFGAEGACLQGLSWKLNSFRLETHSQDIEACGIAGGGARRNVFDYRPETKHLFQFYMDGPRLFRRTMELFPNFLKNLLGPEHPRLADIDWVVPHQASASALRLVRRRLGIPEEKWIDILEDHGNQISVSLPQALHYLLRNKKPKSGASVLLLGTGAGLALGGALLEVQ